MATNEKQVPAETHARHALVTLLLLRALRFKKYTSAYFQFGLVFFTICDFCRKTSYFEDSGLPTPNGALTKEEWLAYEYLRPFPMLPFLPRLYTVKKACRYFRPQPGCPLPNSPYWRE
jgi:hypothetical protein